MAHKLKPALTKQLLLASALAVLAAALPLSLAAAQAPPPASKTLFSAPFKGVAAPAADFDLVQSVVDYAPGAGEQKNTLQAPRFLTVVEGELSVTLGDQTDVYAAGKGVAIPAGTPVTSANQSATATARAFVSALLPAGVGQPVPDAAAPKPAVAPKATFTSRLPMYEAPATLDIYQAGQRADVGFRTPNHIMLQPHLMTHVEGLTGYTYLDGQAETYGPGDQAQMHVGRPGNMSNAGEVPNAFFFTWVAAAGSTLTSPVPAATPVATPAAAPAPPSTGNGLASPATSPWTPLDRFTLAGAGAVALGGLALSLFATARRAGRRRAG